MIQKKKKDTLYFLKFIQCLRGSRIWNYLKKYKNMALTMSNSNNSVSVLSNEENVINRGVKISIVVPLYNTPKLYLIQMLDSVIHQTYDEWELCIADASDNGNEYIVQVIKSYISELESGKIKYKKIDNKGISENTNHAIEMSTGAFIALLDHDDVLALNALSEVNECIVNKDADLIYSDEMIFKDDQVNNVLVYNYKPDYSVDSLRAVNYICHLTVFKKSLINVVGMFNSKYDGSQDHDMILRLTEKADKVEHISKVLYYWRAHDSSVAKKITSKEYAIEAGKKAVLDSLHRNGLRGDVQSTVVHPTIYKVNYEIENKDRILIIINFISSIQELSWCLKKIKKNTKDFSYDFVILDELGTFEYEDKFNDKVVSSLDDINLKDYRYLIFIDSNVQIMNDKWANELVMFGQRSDVGVVGGRISDKKLNCLQNGIILTLNNKNIYMYANNGSRRFSKGYMNQLYYARNVNAVSSMLLLVSTEKFLEVDGFSKELTGNYKDIDFSLKLRKKGYVNVINPYSEGYIYKVYSNRNFDKRQDKFINIKWKNFVGKTDCYYNCNLMGGN